MTQLNLRIYYKYVLENTSESDILLQQHVGDKCYVDFMINEMQDLFEKWDRLIYKVVKC